MAEMVSDVGFDVSIGLTTRLIRGRTGMKQSNWACWTPGSQGWIRSRGTSRRLRRRGMLGKRQLLCRQRICLGARRITGTMPAGYGVLQ